MSVGGFAHGTVHVCRIGLHHCCGRILQAGAVSQDTILEVAICLHAIIFHCAIWLGSYGVTSLETMVRAFALADEHDEMARLAALHRMLVLVQAQLIRRTIVAGKIVCHGQRTLTVALDRRARKDFRPPQCTT